ncbi:hypothetical protein GLOIN_2v1700209 [Rhizophagus irregularis DAOM 181602=DAOM 197198]|uniref:Uncharacterized protein n=2 Tax=Rhizophagus irregularis TaxID=588596 RepID=A0A015J0W7_RHIIW|nr:hypothetical protein GLOIN_2v1700209 [Rhizophagus irregularis DAOM 181602=DAOM 197198]EXX63142.1 hypothetical protein RirG_154990 [Rhizophagus irregularis DAOM 197198w]POG61954.1 hypothetical protein GLOIN_2v1700209 [Rhizophagus irregularis DAOM 181602=DAOM 197198]GBC18458.1 hypothetical protein GLOIN_2v1700209 [Rhizophagus irregularis DAOM 181602=DAOM 197198]|eukprot:XP_025168820.1 hypothetical protein GLOIN_2v1700209 [Rhizophagus irregularis DAOM 181602=DAOM 197198]
MSCIVSFSCTMTFCIGTKKFYSILLRLLFLFALPDRYIMSMGPAQKASLTSLRNLYLYSVKLYADSIFVVIFKGFINTLLVKTIFSFLKNFGRNDHQKEFPPKE